MVCLHHLREHAITITPTRDFVVFVNERLSEVDVSLLTIDACISIPKLSIVMTAKRTIDPKIVKGLVLIDY